MSRTTIIVVALALVCGVATIVLINSLMASSGFGANTVTVVVAADELRVDTKLTADMLKTQRCAKDLIPAGALTSIEEAVDRVVLYPLGKNEPVLGSRLTPKGTSRMAAMIPPGMRSVTILVPTQSNSVAGYIRPGNHVDVLLTISEKGVNDPTGGSTSILVENVEVLGLDQYAAPAAPSGGKAADLKELRSVTLLATQEQSLKLIRGQDMGKLHLTLRSPNDTDRASAGTVMGKSIRIRGPEEAKKPPEEKTPKTAPAVVAPPPVAVGPPVIRTLRGPVEGRLVIESGSGQ